MGTPDRPLPPAAMITLHEIGHALHERPSRLASCDYDRRVKALQKRQEAFNDDIARRNRLAKRARKDPASGRKVKALDARLEPERKALLKEQSALETEQNRIRRMASRGPVIAAYQTALGDLGAPTPYGGTSSKESFAEAFALFHMDPDALRRSLPKVHAWFESDGHLEALKKGQSK